MTGKAIPILIALSLLVCGCGKSEDAQQSKPAASSELAMPSDPASRSKPKSSWQGYSEIPWYLEIKPNKRNPLIGMEYLRARKMILKRGWIPFKGECMQLEPEDCIDFPELDICSIEGLCVFKFKKPGRCLIAVGIGGPPKLGRAADATVRDTTFLEHSCRKMT